MRLPFGYTIIRSSALAALLEDRTLPDSPDPVETPDHIPNGPIAVETMNALKRMYHDLLHNPYDSKGITYKGKSDEEIAVLANRISPAVYQGIEITPAFIQLARTKPWERLND